MKHNDNVPGQRYNYDANHYRFPRSIDGFYPVDRHNGDRLVYWVSVVIVVIWLAVETYTYFF